METDFLQDGLGIRVEDRVLPALDQVVVQIPGVGHVEVPQHHQGLRGPVRPPKVRMTAAGTELPRSPVAEMPEEDLAAEVEMLLHLVGVVLPPLLDQAFPLQLGKTPQLLLHHLDEGVALGVPLAEQVGRPQRHIQLAAADPDTVLAPVVLLLHQEIQALEAPEAGAVLVQEVGQWLLQPDHRQAAFVMEGIAHGRGRKITGLSHHVSDLGSRFHPTDTLTPDSAVTSPSTRAPSSTPTAWSASSGGTIVIHPQPMLKVLTASWSSTC